MCLRSKQCDFQRQGLNICKSLDGCCGIHGVCVYFYVNDFKILMRLQMTMLKIKHGGICIPHETACPLKKKIVGKTLTSWAHKLLTLSKKINWQNINLLGIMFSHRW